LRDEAAVQTARQRRSPFVLITNLPPDRYNVQAVLAAYQGQPSVEPRLHFLQAPAFVDAVFLQNSPD